MMIPSSKVVNLVPKLFQVEAHTAHMLKLLLALISKLWYVLMEVVHPALHLTVSMAAICVLLARIKMELV